MYVWRRQVAQAGRTHTYTLAYHDETVDTSVLAILAQFIHAALVDVDSRCQSVYLCVYLPMAPTHAPPPPHTRILFSLSLSLSLITALALPLSQATGAHQ